MEGIFGLLGLAWAVDVVFAVITLVRNSNRIAEDSRRTADAVSRIEAMLTDQRSR